MTFLRQLERLRMPRKSRAAHRQTSRTNQGRRRFIAGIAAATSVAAFGLPTFGEISSIDPGVLTGDRFDLVIDSLPVNFTGRRVTATAANGSVPGPTLRWREGDTVTIAVTNRLPTPTSIHWHGMRIPAEMDGVPGLSYAGIAPGKTFVYRFPVLQNGTFTVTATSRNS